MNPFDCGPSLFPLTHFAPHALVDWLHDVGLEPPAPHAQMPDWQTWWQHFRPEMSPEQLHRCWQGLDKLRFFAVREVPDRPPVHVLLGVHWDNWEWTFFGDSFAAAWQNPDGSWKVADSGSLTIEGDLLHLHFGGLDDNTTTFAWTVQGDQLRLDWIEHVGPLYKGLPDESYWRAYLTKPLTRVS